jgi:hypothetical protein
MPEEYRNMWSEQVMKEIKNGSGSMNRKIMVE